MGWFRTKEHDLLNEAHTLSLGTLSVINDMVIDLRRVDDLLVEVVEDAKDQAAYHHGRALDADLARTKNSKTLNNIAALTA